MLQNVLLLVIKLRHVRMLRIIITVQKLLQGAHFTGIDRESATESARGKERQCVSQMEREGLTLNLTD